TTLFLIAFLPYTLPTGVAAQNDPNVARNLPITGTAVPQLQAFDAAMSEFMRIHSVPGASLALIKDGRVVYARGFGYADRDSRETVRPESIFRIQSLTKTFTAIAIMQLVQRGIIALDTHVYDYLALEPFLASGDTFDERWKLITIRQLLQHTGGWNRDATYDPLFQTARIAREMGRTPPASAEDIARYMMGQPLDFDPDSKYTYSNLGYLLLGRVIEKASETSYHDYVRINIFRKLNMRSMMPAGGGLEERAPNEVRYYSQSNRMTTAWFGQYRGQSVPFAYQYPLSVHDSAGGLAGNVLDMARFVVALDDPQFDGLLSSESVRQMQAQPPGAPGLDADGKPKNPYYGFGMSVRRYADSRNVWHNGALQYCCASRYAYIQSRRFGWVVLFNIRNNPDGKHLTALIGDVIYATERKIDDWP
ncbi:MAG: beta-lactamase family protein, partial [Leptospiraceae bacterium]|nr:beta-lactamase family protein [Leptospiraceae bacterium]